MSAVKVIAYIIAAIFILWGGLSICGAYGEHGQTGWILEGVIFILAGFGLLWFARRPVKAGVAKVSSVIPPYAEIVPAKKPVQRNNWSIVSIIAILVITLFPVVGGVYGYKGGVSNLFGMSNNWKSIGPPNTSISGLKVFSSEFSCPPVYVILLITSKDQLLSSGVIEDFDVEEWHWTDISNGMPWSDFPIITLRQDENNTHLLWVSYEGKEYWVDQNGKWSLVEGSADSPYLNPVENLVVIDQDYQSRLGWQRPPGEISQIQVVTCHWPESTPTWVFALIKGTKGLRYLYLYEETIGVFGNTIFGCISGFILAVLVILLSTIFLVIYRRRRQSEKRQNHNN